MSETTREMIPILFMYGFVSLLAPFIGFAMWMAFDGDRLREDTAAEVATEDTVAVAPRVVERATTAA